MPTYRVELDLGDRIAAVEVIENDPRNICPEEQFLAQHHYEMDIFVDYDRMAVTEIAPEPWRCNDCDDVMPRRNLQECIDGACVLLLCEECASVVNSTGHVMSQL